MVAKRLRLLVKYLCGNNFWILKWPLNVENKKEYLSLLYEPFSITELQVLCVNNQIDKLDFSTDLFPLCICFSAAAGGGDRHAWAVQCNSWHSDQPAGHQRQRPQIHVRVLHRQSRWELTWKLQRCVCDSESITITLWFNQQSDYIIHHAPIHAYYSMQFIRWKQVVGRRFIYGNICTRVSSFPLYCNQATCQRLNFASRLIMLTYTSLPAHHRKRLIVCPRMSLRP